MRRNRKVTKMLAVLLALVMTFSMASGCGKKEETGAPDVTETEEKAGKEEDVSVSPEEGEEQAEEEESEETEVTPLKLYPRDPGWDTVEYPTQGEQFEDIFIKHGMTVAEVVEAIENSEIEYTSEYDPEQSIGLDGTRIDFFREGNESYCLYVWALAYKDGMPLKDCIVTDVSLLGNRPEINYEINFASRFIDGSSAEDIINMGSDAVEAMKDTTFKDYEYTATSRSTSEGYNKVHVFDTLHGNGNLPTNVEWIYDDYETTYYYLHEYHLPEDAEITAFATDDFEVEYNLDGPDICDISTNGGVYMYSNEDGYDIYNSVTWQN